MAHAERPKGKSSSPLSIGDAIQKMFRRLGLAKRLRQYTVVTSWHSIVGDRIARVTTPRKVQNGVLFVDVKTGPWRTELVMRKEEIMKKIRESMGRSVLKDIRFY